jgi:pyruvate/2-oxoglutarate dehydrogenase complex dihydrolipoamide dehydrogenase (E3) component
VAERYDAVVLGAGPAGEVAAGDLADGGMRVAIVERELVAGECSYWACIPSKTLLRPGEAIESAEEVDGAAEAVSGDLDVAKALAYRDYMVSDYDDAGQVKWLDSKNIDLYRGSGRLDGPGKVVVGDTVLECDHIIIATGSSPIFPPIDGLKDLDGVWTNREATGVKEVPKGIVILGAGPVGTEMAQIMRRLGSEVSLVEGSEHILSREAGPAGKALEEVFKAEGIDIHCGVHATSAKQDGGEYVVTLEDGTELRAEKLLVATGRAPRVDDIGLETTDVQYDKKGVKVDDQLKAADGIYAIGDTTGIALFTHVGKYQARVVAKVILGKDGAKADYKAIPRVVFTDPQVAAVGEPEGAQTGTAQMSGVARTATYTRDYAEKPGFFTLVSDGEKLIGAYGVGPEAGEWLGQATLAIKAGIPIDVLRDTIQPFPTFSEAYLNALLDLS